ncbi:MAG: sterol desaturase family protein [Ilumatobacter sp.]|uniref:sterol desaturase family protein n=1 Tax=Ilumatobacter sp. TaxID=1967498 RepID=UPI00260D74F8|nr:sterol desaturase family protein [Ilumatobacter sp.]MDJ0770721.1 sterol desaturase family protein [Ilumatobacter sp.]
MTRTRYRSWPAGRSTSRCRVLQDGRIGSTTAPATSPWTVGAGDLSTKRETLGVYARAGSARVLIAAAVLLGTVRAVVGGGFGRGDLIALGVTLLITGTVEWIIHRFLLHAPEDAWTSRTLGTGSGHRRHHLDPTDIQWLLLGGLDAGVFITAFGLVTAAWTLPLMWVTGSALLGPFLSAWTLAAIGLAHYEWVHLLVHTRYRCRTRYYRRLARNHRLHHFRNENYWLGVTSNSGDRLLRTYPQRKTDVPLSDTARSLGAP